MTWLILPSRAAFFSTLASAFAAFGLVFAIKAPPSSRAARGLGAAHDLHELRGDSSLPDLVRVQGQRVDQVAGGVCRVLHRDHLGRVFACLVLEHSLKNLSLHVTRQQPIQHRLRLWLVYVVGARSLLIPFTLGDLRRDQNADLRLLS